MGEGKEFREMAECFQKCAESMNKIADITENQEIDEKERETQMEEEMAKFLIHCMKLEKIKARM